MKQEYRATDHFVHGAIGNVRRGQAVFLTSAQAAELVKRKLLEPKQAPVVVADEKPSAVGKVPSSSALPAAQVSPRTTASGSELGEKATTKARRPVRRGAS